MSDKIMATHCFSCGIAQGATTFFVFAAKVRLCESCNADPYKLGRAIQMANVISSIELEMRRKMQFMHRFYFMPISVQRGKEGLEVLDNLVKCRTNISNLEAQLNVMQMERA